MELAGLFDIFEENSVLEGAAFGALECGDGEDIVPRQAVGLGNGSKHLEDVGQFRGELPDGSLPRLVGLFGELFKESSPIALFVKDAGDCLMPLCLDDLWDAVTDQLAVRDLHYCPFSSAWRELLPGFLKH